MLYMIGGSPCSGKSTIALLLARRYRLLHIKLDDLVDEMVSLASADSQPICLLRQDRSPDQIWLRSPEEMTDGSQSERQTAEEIARLLKLSNINTIDIKGENYD